MSTGPYTFHLASLKPDMHLRYPSQLRQPHSPEEPRRFPTRYRRNRTHESFCHKQARSQERRVGKECVSTGRSLWSLSPYKHDNSKHAYTNSNNTNQPSTFESTPLPHDTQSSHHTST